MEKTTSKINTEEIETPNWDKWEEKYYKRFNRIQALINIIIAGFMYTYYIINVLIRGSIPFAIILCIISCLVCTLICGGEYLFFLKFIRMDSRIYIHFLEKTPNAYKEYLECLEQEQYEEAE